MKNKEEINTVIAITEDELNCRVLRCTRAGAGANGSVYKLQLDREPYTVAVKSALNGSLLVKERTYTDFILDRAGIPMPRTLFIRLAPSENEKSYMCMEFLRGVNANDPRLLLRSRKAKAKMRTSIIETLQKLQGVKGERFGSFDKPEFDSWHDFYKPFAGRVLDFTRGEIRLGNISEYVGGVMERAYENYDRVFSDPIGAPTLTHGDFWLPNILIDPRTMTVTGVLDPFNVMWADSDYELFAVIAARGNKYKIYETYKRLNNIPDKCDLKLEFYALFSEIYWYSLTHHKCDSFINMKAKLLDRQLRRFGIN